MTAGGASTSFFYFLGPRLRISGGIASWFSPWKISDTDSSWKTAAMVEATMGAMETTLILSGSGEGSGIEFVTMTSERAEWAIRWMALPENTACVAAARTSLAPWRMR